MAEIVGSKREKDRVLIEVAMDYEESLQLRGHLKSIRFFSEHAVDKETHISQRGKNCATKYFLIPKELRRGFKLGDKVGCYRIEGPSKTFFVYAVNKTS